MVHKYTWHRYWCSSKLFIWKDGTETYCGCSQWYREFHCIMYCYEGRYDTVSDVVESGVHWGSNFQIGSRVLKNCYKPVLMHIYGIQCDFMHRSC